MFCIFVKYYFQVSFNLKENFVDGQNNLKCRKGAFHFTSLYLTLEFFSYNIIKNLKFWATVSGFLNEW